MATTVGNGVDSIVGDPRSQPTLAAGNARGPTTIRYLLPEEKDQPLGSNE